jgi:hypothetical protein
MCGYYYSDLKHCTTTENLQRRGPEDWKAHDYPFQMVKTGYAERFKQPVIFENK